jgi:hypothetical protein
MRLAPALLLPALACGCASMSPQSFDGATPRFEPERFFAGHVRTWGIREDRDGNPVSRFTVDNLGTLDGTDLVLRQHIEMEDGTKDDRSFRIHRVDDHHYEGTATNALGPVIAVAYGNAARFDYDLALDPGNPLEDVHFQQWMYLQPDGVTMMNRTVITKLGITVAELSEVFQRIP